MAWETLLGVVFIAFFAYLFISKILPFYQLRRKAVQHGVRIIPDGQSSPVKLMVVLGSGGHTAEMLSFVWDLLNKSSSNCLNIEEIVYLTTYGDTHSSRKAQVMHAKLKDGGGVKYRGLVLPRARTVGQSYITSVLTTMRSFKKAYPAVLQENPSLILCNGPGTCVAVAVCALLARALRRRPVRIIYVESVARVKTLSLSGKLLYPIVDRFLVQWPQLQKEYPLAEYYGRLC